jgi:hypothetical protein
MTQGLWSRRQARLTANPSRAINGTIVATALIAATSVHEDRPGRIALVTVVTLLVFWLAHVYAEVLEHGLHRRPARPGIVRETMAGEFALVEGPAVSVLVLLLGAVGWLGGGFAINLALANGVVQLMLWGITVARQAGRSWPASVVAGLVSASLGGIVILLEALLH